MDDNKAGIRYFYKHHSINANVSITLKGLSDANDALGITMCHIPSEYKSDIANLRAKYKHLDIQRNPINISKIYLDANTSRLAAGGKKLDKKAEAASSARNHILDVDISYFNRSHISECCLFIIAQLCNNGKLLEPAITTPRIKAFSFFEHLVFPITYGDLAPDASIAVTIFDMNKTPEEGLIGGTCINLFNYQKCLRQGNYSLYVHKGKEGDPRLHTRTVGLLDDPLVVEKNKLYAYIDRHSNRNIKAIPWLDNLAYQTIGKKLEKIDNDANFGALDICLPVFDHPVIWKEQKYPRRDVFIGFSKFSKRVGEALDKTKKTNNQPPPITLLYDPMVMNRKKEDFLSQSNPIADKYYILSRVVDEAIAKELKPSQDEMKEIDEILAKPDFNKMYDKEISLIWRYRYFLQTRKDALVKMLMSVKWENEKEAKEALGLLGIWASIDLEQSIIMLSHMFSMSENYKDKGSYTLKARSAIRQKAIAYLETMKDDDLDSILMQLVQAYRYEDSSNSKLKDFLIKRAGKSLFLASNLMWLLKIEVDNKGNGSMVKEYNLFLNEFLMYIERQDNKLIKKALDEQVDLRKKLLDLNMTLKNSKMKAEEMKKHLRELICHGGKRDMSKFDPVPLPVNPRVVVNGIVAEESSVFKSNTYPMKITFNVVPDSIPHTPNNSHLYPVIFKEGDDLRQDQLILQMFALMDSLLKKVGVDLMFSVYHVVGAGIKDGFSEFVQDSTTISDIKEKYDSRNPIEDFFKKMEAEIKIPYTTILETYVKSCAGYSAVTYLLGIGDRHLENLMMTKSGRFFHIDFGFILGEDPKPFPPPLRICKEMVMAMGGKDSPIYKEFCRKCVDAFLYLRKHSKLIVNLFYLMIHSGLKDLNLTEGHTMLTKLYDRFMPDKNGQDAERGFLQLIHESVNAFFPKLMEAFHGWAMYWK